MIVRIQLAHRRGLPFRGGRDRELAAVFGALLGPVALMAYSLGFWRLAFDMGLAGQFDITGAFSHWQLWIGLGVLLHVSSFMLSRYSRGGELEMPRILSALPGRREAEDELEHHPSLRP